MSLALSVRSLVGSLIDRNRLRDRKLGDAVLREVAKRKKEGYVIDWGVDGIWYEENWTDEHGELLSRNQLNRAIIRAHEETHLCAKGSRGRESEQGLEEGEGCERLLPSSFEHYLLVPLTPQNVSRPSQLLAFPFEEIVASFGEVVSHLCGITLVYHPWLERDDLMQEARIALWSATQTFRGESRFITYAYEVIRRSLMKYARAHRYRRYEDVSGEMEGRPTSGNPDDHDGYLDVLSALGQTTDARLLLAYAAGYSDKEIDEVNVRVRRHRARKRARALLDGLASEAA